MFVFLAVVLVAAACAGDGDSRPPTPSGTNAPASAPSTGSDEPVPRDLVDLARRFGGGAELPREVLLPPPALGDEEEFALLILPADPEQPPERATVSATLRATSEHAYFFVERDSEVDDDVLDGAVAVFEDQVWPRVTEAFGLPPSPGVDGDPRITILHADLGPAVGGYVSGEDAYPTAVAAHSNQREMVYLNLGLGRLGSPAYAQVLAHELQHLIHRRHDADEEVWVNEGLSELAAGLLNEGRAFSGAFLDRPDTQLNAWAQGPPSGAHYGASGLFFAYLLEQTGGDVRELAAQPADGIAGVEAFLQAGGADRAFAELVADWAVANLLDRPEGPYGYREREVSAPATSVIEGPGRDEGEVHQFAADYLELRADDFAGEPLFVFEGETQVPVLAAQADADGAYWWSSRGDSIDATLTRELDLTAVQEATLTFRTWYDIERWYDYGYVAASRDGGRTWQALSGRQTTMDDPLEITYGPGYSGRSGGGETAAWVEERIDLSGYAGSRVLLRFEYLTDEGVNGPGWAIDDIAVPEIGFLDDAESDVGGWQRAGFRRLTGPLTQRFELRLVTLGPAPEVQSVPLDGQNRAELTLAGLGTEYQSAVIVIVGLTEGTTEPGRYRYEVTDSTIGE